MMAFDILNGFSFFMCRNVKMCINFISKGVISLAKFCCTVTGRFDPGDHLVTGKSTASVGTSRI